MSNTQKHDEVASRGALAGGVCTSCVFQGSSLRMPRELPLRVKPVADPALAPAHLSQTINLSMQPRWCSSSTCCINYICPELTSF